MIKQESFSVAMCVYRNDNPQWFQEAVESIINQTVRPGEIVLVVDGPIPMELDKIVMEYEKNKIFKVIRLAENVGHGKARRVGVENCKYALVALMDADDISVGNRFEKQLLLFEKYPEVSCVGGNIEEFIEDINLPVGKRIVPESDKDIKAFMKHRCPFNQMTVMFRKEDVEAVGGYLDWYCNEDYYLWLRMYQANMKFANSNDVLVNVRVGKDMYKRRGGWLYFQSEYRLQRYMYTNCIIKSRTFIINVLKRLIVQLLLPNSVRGMVFRKFARD